MFVDSHCHINFPELAARMEDVRAEMAQAQVDRALVISTTLETFSEVHGLALAYDNFWCTAGVHPDNEGVAEPTVAGLLELAAKPKVVGIGETGLDYFRLNGRNLIDMEWQRERFRVHIQAARSAALPLVIHTRSASDDTLAILRECGETGGVGCAGGVFHCFTETEAVARAALDLGFDRLLIETDSPYLAPVPHRGKTNQPAWVAWVAQQIADIKGLSIEAVAQATSYNFERLFSKSLHHASL